MAGTSNVTGHPETSGAGHGAQWVARLPAREQACLADLAELCARHRQTHRRPPGRVARWLGGARDRPPVFLWTMGKVGTAALYQAIGRAGRDVLFIHSLRPCSLHENARASVAAGRSITLEIRDGARALNTELSRSALSEIVTAVRDPVDYSISAYFQNLTHSGPPHGDIDRHIETFLRDFRHETPLNWFDDQIRFLTGMDILTDPFPVAQGWQAQEYPGLRVLILRADTHDSVKSRALERFLGVKGLRVARVSETRRRRDGPIYEGFRARFRPPESYLDRMYDSRYARHFWLPEEIDAMRRRWTRS